VNPLVADLHGFNRGRFRIPIRWQFFDGKIFRELVFPLESKGTV
jgi:hypothetical protein